MYTTSYNIIHADFFPLHRHEELLVKEGVYASMWLEQNSKQKTSAPSDEETPSHTTGLTGTGNTVNV